MIETELQMSHVLISELLFIFKLSAGVKWVLYDAVIGFDLNGWTKRSVLIVKILLISLGEFSIGFKRKLRELCNLAIK